MAGTDTSTNNSALRMTASVFGVLAGLGGLTHGIGEVQQGNVAPDGFFIDSWATGPIAERMDGDPGITIVPNFLATGILAITVSLAIVIWSAFFVQRKNGGRVLIVLSVALLLVGGGIGSPVIGILAGVAGTRIRSPLTWWRTRLTVNVRHFLALLWPWIFAAAALNGAFLMVGALLLVYFFEVGNAALFLNSFYLAVISLILTIVSGASRDASEAQVRELGKVM